MSLTWSVTDIKDWETVTRIPVYTTGEPEPDYRLSPITHALIFGTMAVGIGHISEKDAPEFYARLALYERMNGSFTTVPDPKDPSNRVNYYITPEDVQRHIGLRTNVFPKETRTKWYKRILDSAMRDHIYTFNRAMEKQAEKVEA